MPLNVRDTLLKTTSPLPNAASSTFYGTAMDLGELSANDDFVARSEFLLTIPAVTTTMVPNASVITYSIVSAATSTLSSSPTVLIPSIAVQTGAGGVGAAGTTVRFRIPVGVQRYVGVKEVSGASVTDSSSLNNTLELLT